MVMKAQSNMIILVGILVFVIVVVLFATQTINLQPPETQEIRDLKDALTVDVQQKMRSDAFEVIKKVSEQGGYWDASQQPASISYRGTDVPYWNLAGQDLKLSKIQVGKEIENGIKVSLTSLDQDVLSSSIGKRVDVGSVERVETDIQNDFVSLRVFMTISVDGYRLKTPIEVSVPAKLGEAIDFANNLVDEQLKAKEQDDGRIFEKFLIQSFSGYQTAAFDGNPKIPSIGVLEGCGSFMHRDWFSVRPEMEALLRGTLANTYTAGKIPDGIDKLHYPSHVLPVYTTMDATFSLGESLDENNFQMAPSPLEIRASSPTYVPICFSEPYVVDYWMLLPIVAELKDQDYRFQFVTQAFILGYEPGDTEDIEVNLDGWKQQLLTCQNAFCDGSIKLQGTDGPVDLATVTYSGCNLGLTDKNGVLESKVPCGISMLEVSKAGYKPFRDLVSSDELKDVTFYMNSKRIPVVKIKLYDLILDNTGGVYTVKDVVPNNKNIDLEVQSTDPGVFGVVKYSASTTSDSLIMDTISGGSSIVSATVSDGNSMLGGLLVSYFLPDADHDLNIYVPMLQTTSYVKEVDCVGLLQQDCQDKALKETQEQSSYVLSLTNITIKCREQTGVIVPLSPTKIDVNALKGCSATL